MDGARLFLLVCSNGTKDNEHGLEHGKFYTNMRKKLLTVLVTGHWNRLPTDVLWRLLLWRYSKPTWVLSCVTYCREPALAEGWTR